MRVHQKQMLWDLFRTTGKIEYYLKWKNFDKENKLQEEE